MAAIAGFSGTVALFYTILLGLLLPVAFIGLMVILPGLGLAPLFAFLTAVKLMRAWSGFAGKSPIAFGAECGLAALVLPALPEIGARAGAGMMASETSWVRELGYRIFRFDAVGEQLLEDCHPPSPAALAGWSRCFPHALLWRKLKPHNFTTSYPENHSTGSPLLAGIAAP